MPKSWAMCLVLLVSCKGSDKPGMASEVEAGGATDAEAEDTARTVAQLFPVRCEAGHADWDWAGCHDEGVGYAKVLECATRSEARAAAAAARLPPSEVARSVCGRIVEKAVRDQAAAEIRYLSDMVAWLKSSKALAQLQNLRGSASRTGAMTTAPESLNGSRRPTSASLSARMRCPAQGHSPSAGRRRATFALVADCGVTPSQVVEDVDLVGNDGGALVGTRQHVECAVRHPRA
jgi:hypothetical protein